MTLVLTMQQKIRGNAGNALLRRPSSSQQNFTHTHDLPPKTLIDKIYAPERLELRKSILLTLTRWQNQTLLTPLLSKKHGTTLKALSAPL